MTGEGPERESVMALIRKYRLEDRIYTPGFVEDVTVLMRAAHIVVLPSRIDGMPLAVLEAQALGKPVVASRVGSLPIVVRDQETGFLCEIGDVPAFCERILQLAHDSELRERMRIAARESVVNRFGAEGMLDGYERAFQAARGRALSMAAVSGKP
jgi:glycosyltransferase involved in cell wall biosynthesis